MWSKPSFLGNVKHTGTFSDSITYDDPTLDPTKITYTASVLSKEDALKVALMTTPEGVSINIPNMYYKFENSIIIKVKDPEDLTTKIITNFDDPDLDRLLIFAYDGVKTPKVNITLSVSVFEDLVLKDSILLSVSVEFDVDWGVNKFINLLKDNA